MQTCKRVSTLETDVSSPFTGRRGSVSLLLLSFHWVSVANAPNVLQPYWLIVLPLDVPDLTASLLL